MEGVVSSGDGIGAMPATVPSCFALSSSMSPNSSARNGQASTQMGLLPSATRSAQPSHFTPLPRALSTMGTL